MGIRMSDGLNVPRDGSADLSVIRSLGAGWIRIVALPDVDLTGYFGACRIANIKILLVLARESGGNYSHYRQEYGNLVDAVQVGNEPDQTSPSSWTMTQAELVSLGKAARTMFTRPMPLIVGGLASGQPSWLAGVDLSWADGIGCLVPDQRVTARAPAFATMREFQGEVITIKTATGNQVTCTPNHPILTRQGWLPARSINEGSEIAQDAIGDGPRVGSPNDIQVPTEISKVYCSLSHVTPIRARRGLSLDFHGDGRDGDVHIVGSDSLLRDTLAQHGEHFDFMVSPTRSVALAGSHHLRLQPSALSGAIESFALRSAPTPGRQAPRLEQHMNPTFLHAKARRDRPARFTSQIAGIQTSDVLVRQTIPSCLSIGTKAMPPLLKQSNEAFLLDMRTLADKPERLARKVCLVQVVNVSVSEYRGHVYNLSTEDEVIVADGIITHNCHPYGKTPSPTWPSPGWGTGLMGPLLDGYAAYGKPLWVTELGLSTHEVTEELQAGYVARCLDYLHGRAEVAQTFWFCLSDAMVPNFGLLFADGSEKVSARAFRNAAPPLPAPTPTPTPIAPNPWQFFSAEQIASAAQLDLGNVQAYWPKIHAQLALCKIADRATQIAAIGTTAVESGMRPIHEYGTPADWAGYEGGAAYAGRGFIQLTHRSNYRTYSQQINDLWQAGGAIDLAARPDDALDPDVAAAVLALYFKSHGIPALAAASDWLGVRRAVYGGTDQAGAARIGRIATALGTAAPPTPVPTDPSAPYILALKTLRDSTLPAVEAQVKELRRIVEQYVGSD